MNRLLDVDAVDAGYGRSRVLFGMTLHVGEGESVALVGVTRRHGGTIALAGRDITALRPHERAAAGIGWVPQERNIFKSLTVDENLAAVARPGPWTVERAYGMFPRLAERKANLGSQLSGGEQQMLAVARALVLNPKLLLLDEPLEGLAPIIVEELVAALRRMLAEEGTAFILIEQHAELALSFTEHALMLERGRIVHRAPSAELARDAATLERYVGLKVAEGT